MTPDSRNGNGSLNGDLAEFKVDRRLMLEVIQRGKRRFVVVFLLVVVAMLIYNLFVMPQTFSSTVSFSLMQSQGPSSPLATLAGLGGGKQSYLGVLKSRKFAEIIERQEGIQAFYKLETPEEAVEIVKKAIKVEENLNDGLINVTCTLKGPARMESSKGNFRKAAARKAANIANAYAHELLVYLKNSDTDRDATLLRQAESEVRLQRENYIGAVAGLQNFVRARTRGVASAMTTPQTMTAPAGMVGENGSLAAATAGSEIQQLYIQRGSLEVQLEALRTSRSATKALIENSPNSMEQMPDEDPLLGIARAQVNQARSRLNSLLIMLADENPRVIEARQALALADKNLKEKKDSYLRGQTSEGIKLKTVQASYDKVIEQIRRAEKNFQFGREALADYETQKNEVMLALEALKTVSARYAEMRLSMVSAQNRMVIIDNARPARYGVPGLGMASILSLFVGIGAVAVWIGFAYLSLALRIETGVAAPENAAAPLPPPVETK